MVKFGRPPGSPQGRYGERAYVNVLFCHTATTPVPERPPAPAASRQPPPRTAQSAQRIATSHRASQPPRSCHAAPRRRRAAPPPGRPAKEPQEQDPGAGQKRVRPEPRPADSRPRADPAADPAERVVAVAERWATGAGAQRDRPTSKKLMRSQLSVRRARAQSHFHLAQLRNAPSLFAGDSAAPRSTRLSLRRSAATPQLRRRLTRRLTLRRGLCEAST